MTIVNFRFYGELNNFLPPPYRQQSFSVTHRQRSLIKDMIVSLGVSLSAVELIIVNGESLGFNYIVKANDRISVYPCFQSIDVSCLNRLKPCH